jgi:hypothetical protein
MESSGKWNRGAEAATGVLFPGNLKRRGGLKKREKNLYFFLTVPGWHNILYPVLYLTTR